MTEETQGIEAEPQETQGDIAEIAPDTETQEPTQEESDNSEETPVEEAQKEEVQEEVDYKSRYEKLEKESKARQDKINKQRAALSQNNKKVQELSAQLEALQVSQAAVSKEPVVDDYETFEEFTDALASYKADALVKSSQEKMLLEQKQIAEAEKQRVQNEQFNRAEADYRVKNPNYDLAKDELAKHIEVFPVNTPVANAILEQASRGGNVAEIINYFGADNGAKIPEFDRIAALSPTEAAVEIYKIQTSLKNVSPVVKNPLPKPIKSLNGGAKLKRSPQDSMSINEWMESRNKQIRRK